LRKVRNFQDDPASEMLSADEYIYALFELLE
jgi:hypothetical protein